MMQAGAHCTATIPVERTPEEAFAAAADVRGWWSQEIEGVVDQDVHRRRVRATELSPGQKVAWHVLDNYVDVIDHHHTAGAQRVKRSHLAADLAGTEARSA